MNEESKTILKLIGFEFDELTDMDGIIIPRETLLSDAIYDKIKTIDQHTEDFWLFCPENLKYINYILHYDKKFIKPITINYSIHF